GGALAHAEDAVPIAVAGVRLRPGRVADGDLDGPLVEDHVDVRLSESMTGCVGERLLEDAVGGLVDGRGEWVGWTVDVDGDRQTGGSVAGGDRLERGEAGGWIDRLRDSGRRLLLAQGAHELVDLADRLTGDLLDRLQRRPNGLGVALL